MNYFPAAAELMTTTTFAESHSVKVFVKGRPIDASVIETNGTFYLPVDAVSIALGVHITNKTNEVRIVREPALPATTPPKTPPPPQPNPLAVTAFNRP